MKPEVSFNAADHSVDSAFARDRLLEWFTISGRTFPWRHRTSPYEILMAEMMLRRTQARQVIPVFERFIKEYPDAHSLAAADEKTLREILYPLGLEWRAANFEKLAAEIVQRHNGQVPTEKEALLALTGVGPYVAEAVRIFAFKLPGTIMDTNTVRVAARYFGFEYDAESRRKKPVIEAVAELTDKDQPADSAYALLDFAATVCQARQPKHTGCPLAERCAFFLASHT